MSISADPWFHPQPRESQIQLNVVPEGAIHALARGEGDSLALQYASPYLAGPECAGLWRMRSAQIRESPADIPWITRLIVDPHVTIPVGLAGFHGAPNELGTVEIGYRIDPLLRGRDYAKRALEILMAEARRHPDVATVRATIRPDNAVSIALVTAHGFTQQGEQWDEEDGLETIYEVSVRQDS